ncbi:hypothetical protein OHS70_32995 [Streptomyces sp. NBC_00390]|uniref:hypothetical protein n=1 Tax=Streptomyces sp. NBC_00390 TaxID=2975736 RepID=UPI002E203018
MREQLEDLAHMCAQPYITGPNKVRINTEFRSYARAFSRCRGAGLDLVPLHRLVRG